MDLETIRVIVSVGALLMLILIWRLLHQIHRQIRRVAVRLDAEAHALHILAADDGTTQRALHSVPPRR